ncbi:PAS domain-containing sensor histidine kinase [Yeosuana marina]|uniref:PAS domain-containing sensor histidine kinase n=1 Tax=Yeosuana marina TaxID=1565536 RepID=UPI0030EE5619|tara:strand:+ start:867 stop:2111 length:1245 start_codon:yes stop_codon:yes gene_type:complete
MFQKEQDVFNILFEAVSEGVIVVNNSQIIVATNISVEKMFGYDNKELIGLHINELIPREYHAKHSSYFKGFVKQDVSRKMGLGRDLYGLRKDNTVFPLEIGLNPFEFQEKKYVMALIIDISARKKHEQQILELNTQLEEKVLKRTKELSKAVNDLKALNSELEVENIKRIEAEKNTKIALQKEIELNELKTKFLSLVSHEFKTPLSGILTSTMLLGKYKLTEQQENREKHLKTITDRVHYLNNILNDFLSIDKLETGKIKYNFSDFKLSKVVNEVVYSSNLLLKQGQKIKYPDNIDDISLYQDEKIVELALSNLVHNAIKYSPEDTEIEIDVRQNYDKTTFDIKDKGIGIPIKDQKNIFNRYFRAENALLTQGTGIGLNIVKTHLENLGGNIKFVSEENKGTTFTITIPNKPLQ